VAEKVIEKITEKHGLTDPPAFLELVRLMVASLSVKDHDEHAMGKLTAFMGQAHRSRSHRSSTRSMAISGGKRTARRRGRITPQSRPR
jgi:hypothetical protein